MAETKRTVYERRGYKVLGATQAKRLADKVLADWGMTALNLAYGLPEVDDRYHVWRVPLVLSGSGRVGEVVFDARTQDFDPSRSTDPDVVCARIAGGVASTPTGIRSQPTEATVVRSQLRNMIIQGDSEETLAELPAESIDLVFTSPPYFNARPDYAEYVAYEEYLEKMRQVIRQCHRLLAEGRFFVINVAPVLIRRASRNESSRRIAVPFDLHRIFIEEGFDFVDDIIWEKPSGAGWATGRGRRFAADRNPLQYKAVPVTEYVLVYRKHTDRLIDWNIRSHPDQDAVRQSRVGDDYERTNIWRISPANSKDHPAVFPPELVERVLRYYSFKGDIVLDPFAGSGTLGKVAASLDRRFALVEMDHDYIQVIRKNVLKWLGADASDVMCINCSPIAATEADRVVPPGADGRES